jgi:hypothetical protein
VGHPIEGVLRQFQEFGNEERGEVSLSYLSSMIAGEVNARADVDRVRSLYKDIGAHRVLTNTARERLGLRTRSKTHETTDVRWINETMRMEAHLKNVAKKLMDDQVVDIYVVGHVPVADADGYYPGGRPGEPGRNVKNYGEVSDFRVNLGAVTTEREELRCHFPHGWVPETDAQFDHLHALYHNNTSHAQLARWQNLSAADRLNCDKDGYVIP